MPDSITLYVADSRHTYCGLLEAIYMMKPFLRLAFNCSSIKD